MDQQDLSRLLALRLRLFAYIDEMVRRGDSGKVYEGTFEIIFPSYFHDRNVRTFSLIHGDQNSRAWGIKLHCYLIGPARHYDWMAESLSLALDAAERDKQLAEVRAELDRERKERKDGTGRYDSYTVMRAKYHEAQETIGELYRQCDALKAELAEVREKVSAIDTLNLSKPVRKALLDIEEEIRGAYQDKIAELERQLMAEKSLRWEAEKTVREYHDQMHNCHDVELECREAQAERNRLEQELKAERKARKAAERLLESYQYVSSIWMERAEDWHREAFALAWAAIGYLSAERDELDAALFNENHQRSRAEAAERERDALCEKIDQLYRERIEVEQLRAALNARRAEGGKGDGK